jgi:hypothetical protein
MWHNDTIADLLASIGQAGGTIRRYGDKIELAAPAPLAPELIARIRAAKPALLAMLDNPSDWQRRYREALAYWKSLHPSDEAAALAWGEMQNRWHRLHGERFPVGRCAGCGRALRNLLALEVDRGTQVHVDDLACLISYGDLWRSAANRGLVGLGLTPPAGDQS